MSHITYTTARRTSCLILAPIVRPLRSGLRVDRSSPIIAINKLLNIYEHVPICFRSATRLVHERMWIAQAFLSFCTSNL